MVAVDLAVKAQAAIQGSCGSVIRHHRQTGTSGAAALLRPLHDGRDDPARQALPPERRIGHDGVHADEPIVNRPIGQRAQAPIVARNGCEDGRDRQALQDPAMDALGSLALMMETCQGAQLGLSRKAFLQNDIAGRLKRGLGQIHEQNAAFILRRTVAPAVESQA